MKSFRFLLLILALKTVFMGVYIVLGPLGLTPDEAQYWTWSQALDWGYYSKPPGIAWAIRMGTSLFGNTELGVRFPALAFAICIPLAVYILARYSSLSMRTASWAGAAAALTPMGFLSSLFATTDPGFILFWTLGCAVIARGIRENRTPNYSLLGAAIVCGALFKWPAYYLWLVVLFCLPFYPQFRTRRILLGIAVSILGLLPSLYWNAAHDWPTVKHVWFTLPFAQPSGGGAPPNPVDFFAAQGGLMSPVLFILMFPTVYSLRKGAPAAVRFCGYLAAAIITVHFGMACFKKMQGNWCVYAYPPAFVALAWYLCDRVSWGTFWFKIGIGLSTVLSATFLLFPPPFKINPFRECMGWRNFASILDRSGYDPKRDFLFGESYQMSSLLSFYGPKQKLAYFLNLTGRRRNQFSYWPGMEDKQLRKTGFFISQTRSPGGKERVQIALSPYFSKLDYLGSPPLLISYGKTAKYALVFRCRDYNGKIPEESRLY